MRITIDQLIVNIPPDYEIKIADDELTLVAIEIDPETKTAWLVVEKEPLIKNAEAYKKILAKANTLEDLTDPDFNNQRRFIPSSLCEGCREEYLLSKRVNTFEMCTECISKLYPER